jgi:hypothetical protein
MPCGKSAGVSGAAPQIQLNRKSATRCGATTVRASGLPSEAGLEMLGMAGQASCDREFSSGCGVENWPAPSRREEADRARAVLLSLEGWSSVDLGAAFGVTADSVRHWRNWFAVGGVAALCTTPASGPSPAKGEWALSIASAILSEAVENVQTGRSHGYAPRSSGAAARPSRSRD